MAGVVKGPWAARPPRSNLFARLEGELGGVMPSPGQEALVADLVTEISGLSARLGLGAPENPARWLKGFVVQLSADLWPPQDAADWQRVIGGLKARKGQYQARIRKGNKITPPQVRKIWAVIRDSRYPYIDEELVYTLIAENYPKAKRKKRGVKLPSLSMLTKKEAHQLIELLVHPGNRSAV